MTDNVITLHMSWRDYLPNLTASQAEELVALEARAEIPPVATSGHREEELRKSLLFAAQDYVGQNHAAARNAGMPLPHGAVWASRWTCWGDGAYYRIFAGRTQTVGPATVEVSGCQNDDGSVERAIHVRLNHDPTIDDQLTATEARRLGVALFAVADELDGLTR